MILLLFNFGIQELIILAIIAAMFVLPILALVDIVKSNFKESNNKIMWVLIVLLLPMFGSIVYFVIGRDQKVTG